MILRGDQTAAAQTMFALPVKRNVPVMSALGRQRPLRTLPPEWPLSGVKRTLNRPQTRQYPSPLTAKSGRTPNLPVSCSLPTFD